MAEPDPASAPADGSALVELVEVFARLQREDAWRAVQTHRTLARFLIEEAYEAVEALDADDPDALRDELGDLLLQVYLHSAMAAERGVFDVDDVARGLRDKMVRRNPHVFAADGSLDGAAAGPTETDPDRIDALYQSAKAAERDRPGVMDGVPLALPALLRATKALDRLERAGHPVAPDPASADLGERLLALVAEARAARVDPEQALRDAVRRVTGPPVGGPAPD